MQCPAAALATKTQTAMEPRAESLTSSPLATKKHMDHNPLALVDTNKPLFLPSFPFRIATACSRCYFSAGFGTVSSQEMSDSSDSEIYESKPDLPRWRRILGPNLKLERLDSDRLHRPGGFGFMVCRGLGSFGFCLFGGSDPNMRFMGSMLFFQQLRSDPFAFQNMYHVPLLAKESYESRVEYLWWNTFHLFPSRKRWGLSADRLWGGLCGKNLRGFCEGSARVAGMHVAVPRVPGVFRKEVREVESSGEGSGDYGTVPGRVPQGFQYSTDPLLHFAWLLEL